MQTSFVGTETQKLLSTFLSGRNQNTLHAYQADLEDFSCYLKLPNAITAISSLLNLSQGQANHLVLDYRNHLSEDGLQSSTVNRRLSSIRAVIKLARMTGMIAWALEVPNIKSQSYRDTRGVGTNGIDALLNLLEQRNDLRALRDIAIIRLFFDVGLRVSEATNLDLPDLDLQNHTIEILGKGRTQREKLTIPDGTIEALKAWLAVRPNHDNPAVFLNFDRAKKGTGRITRFGVYKVIRLLGADLNLKTRPHGIRHDAVNAAIREAQANGIELPSVLQFSRHRHLTTLQVYIDAITNRQGELATLVSGSVGKKGR